MSFKNFDASYWETGDTKWVKQREREWKVIAPMFNNEFEKTKRGMTIVEKYFFTGKLPNFDKLQNFNDDNRHLDLFCFLWLHPSWDESVLTKARDQYIYSSDISIDDVTTGRTYLMSSGVVGAARNISLSRSKKDMQTGHAQLLFRLMMQDFPVDELIKIDANWARIINKRVSYQPLHTHGRWLCLDGLTPLNEGALFQYPEYLQYWISTCLTYGPDFFKSGGNKSYFQLIPKALYRIFHFDIEKEGDTCRTRYVLKMKKILEEVDFAPEFKAIWADVKAGNTVIENPWKY